MLSFNTGIPIFNIWKDLTTLYDISDNAKCQHKLKAIQFFLTECLPVFAKFLKTFISVFPKMLLIQNVKKKSSFARF